MHRAITMLTRHEIRHDLLIERGVLLTRYHDALERADAELDAREIDDSMDPEQYAEYWYAFVLSSMSDTDLHKLGEIIAALERLDEGTYGLCRTCTEEIDERCSRRTTSRCAVPSARSPPRYRCR